MHTLEADWTTEAGMRAVVLFVQNSHRCGYVQIPEGHPLYRVGYDQECDFLKERAKEIESEPIGDRGIIELLCGQTENGFKPRPSVIFDVHGSITYDGSGEGYMPKAGWWYGFDCAHAGDKTRYSSDGEERTLEYVKEQCEKLAKQLAMFIPVVT